MFLIEPMTTARHVDVVTYENKLCLKTNGTIIDVLSFVQLVYDRYYELGCPATMDIEGLFLSIANRLPVVNSTEVRYVKVDSDKLEWELHSFNENGDLLSFNLTGPETLAFQLQTRDKLLDFMDNN